MLDHDLVAWHDPGDERDPTVREVSHALSARNPALRMRLWSEEEVRELLDPTKMQLSGLFNGSALVRYLAESQKENFLYEEQWQRLLSMETTLNALAQTGARPRI